MTHLTRTHDYVGRARRLLEEQRELSVYGLTWTDRFTALIQTVRDIGRVCTEEVRRVCDHELNEYIRELGDDAEMQYVVRLRNDWVKGGRRDVIAPEVHLGNVIVLGFTITSRDKFGEEKDELGYPSPRLAADSIERSEPNPDDRWLFASEGAWQDQGIISALDSFLIRWEQDILPYLDPRVDAAWSRLVQKRRRTGNLEQG